MSQCRAWPISLRVCCKIHVQCACIHTMHLVHWYRVENNLYNTHMTHKACARRYLQFETVRLQRTMVGLYSINSGGIMLAKSAPHMGILRRKTSTCSMNDSESSSSSSCSSYYVTYRGIRFEQQQAPLQTEVAAHVAREMHAYIIFKTCSILFFVEE
jgi:hypothetical protein